MASDDEHERRLEHDYMLLHERWVRDNAQYERIRPVYAAAIALALDAEIIVRDRQHVEVRVPIEVWQAFDAECAKQVVRSSKEQP